MSDLLLDVQNISVDINGKSVLHGIDLKINKGETHVFMGPNGAGKSTLGNTLMGNPVYTLTEGKIIFDGKDLTEEKTDVRAKAGMFLSFQNPLEVPGISLETFIRSALQQRTGEHVKLFQFQKDLQAAMQLLNMDISYASRDLNVGFSGGERKKSEILQMLMLKPKFAILDETDSGLDVDAVRTVSKGIEAYKQNGGTLLIITHSAKILESLTVDFTHVLVKGKIVKTGDASLVDEINKNGFERFEKDGTQ
ncbi:Fe-S cluster assembly ATPase SufC [Treponema socranskii]|uniref:FeS assembly ATPase SufC n=1 Tax=Treponema socranskii subsp. socranskii VPI DR56BR1116 = ATCC 35536 TaxID=1125725 RepID=U2LHA0_TRESO|nr:Fe-S cluster assembly ATPase SufC [Treponema socranskii]ERF60998.1 FeS assembly ATPase SufC [Treponema socranskii subsp. socranskii VPI DR56BR1116 = ATCC 35536]ERK03848.1 FeS assembly ATPase SufC [Treponema socranskii subsp. socranskii VPI DR56BR1116 = ATCC 35536]MDR9858681.1 Fe-S cluster assembly ATPase SufC [Treponema socranskii]